MSDLQKYKKKQLQKFKELIGIKLEKQMVLKDMQQEKLMKMSHHINYI